MSPDLSFSLVLPVGAAAAFGAALLAAVAHRCPRRPLARPLRDEVPGPIATGHESASDSILDWLPSYPVGVDRRREPRRGDHVTPAEVIVPGGEPAGALVLNRSDGGLGFAIGGPLAVGHGTFVRAGNGPWVEVEVRHCRPHADYFLVGCRFREAPPWEALIAFG